MILDQVQNDVVISGPVKTSSFKIQASAKAFDILSSNIYTHKVRAVIREISCNAHDAHVASGNTNPFDVHLPTPIEPWFSVRDYGKGLNDEEVREIFTTYFFSTKTNSNDFVGALGLGSKSPFCLVDSFNVTSYNGGLKSCYVCFRGANGEPQISLLSQNPSDQPSGLEVNVAVSSGDINEFHGEAIEIYQYFECLPNINIGSVLEGITNDQNRYTVKTKNYAFSNKYGDLRAVMGNVCYNIPRKYLGNLYLDGFIRFNIGELSFDPGRENLSMDNKTIESISKRIEGLKTIIVDDILSEIEQQPTIFKKRLVATNYRAGGSSVYGMISTSTRNKEFQEYLFPEYSQEDIEIYQGSDWRSTRTVSKYMVKSLNCANINKCKFFLREPGYHARIREWVRNNNSNIVLVNENHIKFYEIDQEYIERLSTLPKVTRSRSTSSSTKRDSDKVFLWNGKTYDGRSIDRSLAPPAISSGENIYITIDRGQVVNREYGLNSLHRIQRTLDALKPKINPDRIHIVKQAFFSTKQFQKGQWIKLSDYIKREVEKCLTKDDKIYSYNGDFADTFTKIVNYVKENNLDQEQYADLVRFVALLEKVDDEFLKTLVSLGLVNSDQKSSELEDLEKTIVNKFPVFKLINRWVGNDKIALLVDILEKTCLTLV